MLGGLKDLGRIAKSLERLVVLQRAALAARGIMVTFEDDIQPQGEREVLLTDPEKLAEIEARREKYEYETGIDTPGGRGPLNEHGEEWVEGDKEEEAPSLEELFLNQRAPGSHSEGLTSPGPEEAETGEGEVGAGGSTGGAPTGHIPR